MIAEIQQLKTGDGEISMPCPVCQVPLLAGDFVAIIKDNSGKVTCIKHHFCEFDDTGTKER